MKIDQKLVEQWVIDIPTPDAYKWPEYIAQRAADHALEEAAKTCRAFGKTLENDVGENFAEEVLTLKVT